MKKCKMLFIAMALSLGLSVSVRAAPVPAITSFGITAGRTGTGQSVGIRFTAEDDLYAKALGFYDSAHDGLNADHIVSIWNETGTLLDSVTVLTDSPLTGSFRYADLTNPVLLTTGNDYYLVTTLINQDYVGTHLSAINTDSRVTYVDSYYKVLSAYDPLVFPDTLSPEINDYIVVNALIDAVPIPGAVWLFGSGLIGIIAVRRKFSKS